jgi:hypothetical protein
MEPSTSTIFAEELKDGTKEKFDEINKLPLEVFSPKAPIGNSGPITFVSKTLGKFVALPALHNRWKRASFSRPVKQFELGYWVIETSSWSLQLQLAFWKELTKHIETRNLGISTWCKRLPKPNQLGTVKVFCWGEIVEHLYLFLLTISDTGVSSQEACWLDRENKVVVRVRQRQSSR